MMFAAEEISHREPKEILKTIDKINDKLYNLKEKSHQNLANK